MSENFPSGDIPKNKITPKQDTLTQKKSGTIDRKMVGGSERLKEITKNQLGALDSVVINQNIIKRFGNRAANIRERFDTLNAQYKEDTGLVMKGMDKIVGVFGGETVQSTYESMIGNLQREAAAMLREIDSIVPKVVRHFTRDQVAEMNITLRTLSGILGDTLNVPTFGEMAGTTARSLGSAENWKDGASNALHGAKGVLEGVGESVWMVIKSIPDLAIFCYHFATQESTRDVTAKFMTSIGGFITENAWKGETWEKASVIISDVISKEMKRIGTLPQGEQAEAIGRIPGLIIGALMGGGIVLKGVAKFGKGVEALGTTIQKVGGATKLKKIGGKVLEKTGALAVGVGETGDLVFGAKRLLKNKKIPVEAVRSGHISETLDRRIRAMSDRLFVFGSSRDVQLNPDVAEMIFKIRDDLIAAQKSGNIQEVEALLKKSDAYFERYYRSMFPSVRIVEDPYARRVEGGIFATMLSYSAHRPLSELGPRGREIGKEAERLYRELKDALSSNNPEQFDQILKECDRFQKNPEKYLDGQTIETIDEFVDTLGDRGEHQIINNGDVIDWSKDISEKLVQLKEFLGDMKSIPIIKLKQFLDDLGLILNNSAHLPSGASLKITEKIAQIRQRFFPVDGLFVKGQTINYRFGDGSIGKVRLERWNEQTGLWDVSWKDRNGVIRIQKDISMEGYIPSVEAEKLIKDREKKSLDQKKKSGEDQKNQQKPEKKEEVSTGKARMTEIDPASFPHGELSRDAQKLFNVKGMPQPRYKIEIDGQEFFVSKRGVGGKNRDCILGYVKVGYQYEPRLFYFSQSGGNWHCAPGVDRATKSKDLRFSKGEPLGLQYEKGTVVGRELDQIFSKLGEEGIDVSIMSTWEEQFGRLDPRDDLHKRYFQKFKDKYQHEFQSTKLYQNAGSFADLDEGLSFEGVKQKISSIPIDPKFDMNFRGGFRKGPDMHHQHLKHVKTTIGETNWNGKPIEVTFAHAADNPDLMWIENIVFRDSPLNSHGIPTQQVDGGLLTAKPLEYWNQVPRKIKNEGIVYGDYRDIRPYIQLNPLIVRFKQLQGYQRAA